MKGFAVFTKSLIFVLILSASAFAQTEKTKTPDAVKIVLIDTTVFYDKEKGIKEIVETNDKLEAEFQAQADEFRLMGEKIQKMEKELRSMASIYAPRGITAEMIEAKIKEYESEIEAYKTKEKELKSLYDKRKSEIFADVNKKIGDAIKQFAKEKGYAILVDTSKMNDGSILACPEPDDVTEAFIKYYNENFAETKTQ